MEEELKKKLQRVEELAKIISIGMIGRRFTPEVKQEEENLRYRLEYRLNELVTESKCREADIKIEIMEQIVTLLKGDKIK